MMRESRDMMWKETGVVPLAIPSIILTYKSSIWHGILVTTSTNCPRVYRQIVLNLI